jgi:hypothetical protein
MCSLRFENNLLTVEAVRFASISKKTPLSKLSFAFVSLALPLLNGYTAYVIGGFTVSHLYLKFAKIATIFFVKNINVGIKKTQKFMLISNSLMPT